MRTVGWKTLGCLIALSASWLHAQPIPLIHLRQTPWRYYEAGNQPANAAQPDVAWNQPGFDDSSWSQGLGLFGVEDNPAIQPQIQTYLWLTPPAGTSQTITYYFRTQFQWNGGSNAFLWCTNILDDGAVVYLNGIELYRIRIEGTPTYATLAPSAPVEGARETVNVFTSRLLAGMNHLAVEVHQASPNSADVVFGLAVNATIPEPVAITRQPPAAIDAVAFDDIRLSVEATGSALRYAWFRNNAFITGQTNATLILNNLQTSQAATYHVVVSNMLGAVRSSNSVLRVVPDTFSPRILSAVLLTTETNRLYVNFSEDILRFNGRDPAAGGTNVNNYVVTDIASGASLQVTLAVVAPAQGLARLSLAQNLDRRRTYEICISNISDVRTNFIALNSCVPVSYEIITNSVPYRSHWWFYDWTDPPPPPDWNQPEFVEDPQFWYLAPGMFYNDLMGPMNPPCTSPGWVLSLGPSAYYFRKRFTVPPHLVGKEVSAMLGRVIDDGVVFYLNGTEIMRTNMPAGPIAHDTRALASGNPNVCSTNTFAIDHLLREQNVLAAEVHQFAQSDYDVAFDASLALRYLDTPELTNRPPDGDVFLRYSNHGPTELRLFWTNGMGYVLEYVDALGDPWRELQPPSTNVVVNTAGSTRFYRLNKRH